MDMAEYTAEFSSDHSTLVIKRSKRSKRPRPSSPFCPAAVTGMTSSYSSGGDGDGGGGGAGSGSTNYYPTDEQNNSPSTSTDLSDATAEEAELVDCLMMLARGKCPMKKLKKDGQQQSTDKFNSGRRSAESVTSTAPAAAEKGHQCVTCNRIFPSFQALGGHRASHKKPKLSPPEENTERSLIPLTNYLPPLVNSDEDEEEDKAQLQGRMVDRKFTLAPVPLQMISGNGKAVKLHGCSICGMEFASGQALGGHMRKHRPIPPATSPPPAYSYPPNAQIVANIDSTEGVVVTVVDNRSDNILPFDLNLPAPDDDHQGFVSTSTRIVIPASAWLNCN